MYKRLKLNETANLSEARVNRTLHKGDEFENPNGVRVKILDVDNEHLLDGEPQVTYRFSDSGDTKCFKASSVNSMLSQNRYTIVESSKLEEADEEEEETSDEEKVEDIEDSQEEVIDSEDEQDENPVEEEPSQLDTQLNELRDILIDLDDIRLYQISNGDEEFYILGKVSEDSDDVEMLVDTQPIEVTDDTEDSEKEPLTPEEVKVKYDFVKLPLQFSMIKDMNPKYGVDLTPDHESIMEFLMNLLIEQNPEAADEKQDETPIEEPVEDIEEPIENIEDEEENDE